MIYLELTKVVFEKLMQKDTKFSQRAISALYDFLTEEFEYFQYDPVSLEGEWVEEDFVDTVEKYDLDEDWTKEQVVAWLRNTTTVLPLEGRKLLYGEF